MNIVDAVAIVQIKDDQSAVLQYQANCGGCGRKLWRLASFRVSRVDYIDCEICRAMNVVRRPR